MIALVRALQACGRGEEALRQATGLRDACGASGGAPQDARPARRRMWLRGESPDLGPPPRARGALLSESEAFSFWARWPMGKVSNRVTLRPQHVSWHDKGRPMPNFLSKILSIGADRELKEFERITARVGDLEPRFQAMDDEELRGDDRPAAGAPRPGASRSTTCSPRRSAAVREASVRTLGLRHFDVQIIGGHRPAQGDHRRDEDRRGQDARLDARGLPQCHPRQGRPHRHRQRLPRSPPTASGWAASIASSGCPWASSRTACGSI